METTPTTTGITAVRSAVNDAKGTATLTVTFPDGRVDRTTGKAAYRAAAVVIAANKPGEEPWVFGVRGDLFKAQGEAEKLRTATRKRLPSQFRGQPARYREITPRHFAAALPVTAA